MAYLKQRPTVAKGRRPHFFDDPSIDKLLSMVMALTAELSVLRERVDTHQQLAEQDLLPTSENVETFEISEPLKAERAEQRAAFLKRVLRVISDDLERMKREAPDQPSDPGYPQPENLDQ